MELFSYIVARDFGFAPNPFYSYCSLATCKPLIRKNAKVGDWVVGTGSSKRKITGHLVYAMRVSEVISFNEYWNDSRFQSKKPNLKGSIKQAFGDNIYFQNNAGWTQSDSHHSLEGGELNPRNVKTDTQTDKVLISDHYFYWGGSGPIIPSEIGIVCPGRNHRHFSNIEKSKYFSEYVDQFCSWVSKLPEKGYLGEPVEWQRNKHLINPRNKPRGLA